jgi:hypothetical protein
MNSSVSEVDPGRNVWNAFRLVRQCNESLQKLLPELDIVAREEGFISIIPATTSFLRYRSDPDCVGWLISSFIKLYQNSEDQTHPIVESLRQGAVFGVEVSMDWKDDERPLLYLSRFEYDTDMTSWQHLPVVTDHAKFYWPLRRDDCELVATSPYMIRVPPKHLKSPYWGLERVIYTTADLMAVNSRETIRSDVFHPLRKLRDLKP